MCATEFTLHALLTECLIPLCVWRLCSDACIHAHGMCHHQYQCASTSSKSLSVSHIYQHLCTARPWLVCHRLTAHRAKLAAERAELNDKKARGEIALDEVRVVTGVLAFIDSACA